LCWRWQWCWPYNSSPLLSLIFRKQVWPQLFPDPLFSWWTLPSSCLFGDPNVMSIPRNSITIPWITIFPLYRDGLGSLVIDIYDNHFCGIGIWDYDGAHHLSHVPPLLCCPPPCEDHARRGKSSQRALRPYMMLAGSNSFQLAGILDFRLAKETFLRSLYWIGQWPFRPWITSLTKLQKQSTDGVLEKSRLWLIVTTFSLPVRLPQTFFPQKVAPFQKLEFLKLNVLRW